MRARRRDAAPKAGGTPAVLKRLVSSDILSYHSTSQREAPMPRREFVPHGLSVAALVAGVASLLSSSVMAQEKQSAKVLELDHVSICGPNLDALRQAFAD